jgi:hypothetical protein
MKMSETTYQVILSTDGKHTVIVSTDDVVLSKGAIEWAKATFDQVVKLYGLKCGPSHKNENGEASSEEVVPNCAIHNVPMAKVQGKYGPFWSCHERSDDGSFCNYRPNGH